MHNIIFLEFMIFKKIRVTTLGRPENSKILPKFFIHFKTDLQAKESRLNFSQKDYISRGEINDFWEKV